MTSTTHAAVRAVLTCTFLLAACGRDAPQAPAPPPPKHAAPPVEPEARPRAQPPRPAPPSVAVIEGDLGGWTPVAEDLAFAARLGDPAQAEDAWEEIREFEDRARQFAVVRAGLRLADPGAARAAAALVLRCGLSAQCDLWEARRASALFVEAALDPTYLLPDGDVPFIDDLYEIGGGTDLAAFLRGLAATSPPEERFSGCGSLHKLTFREHLPLLGAAIRVDEAVAASEAWGLADIAMMSIDENPDAAVETVRAWLARSEEVAIPSPSADPVGAARVILEQQRRLAPPGPRQSGALGWTWRLLARTPPSRAAGHLDDLRRILDIVGESSNGWSYPAHRLLGALDDPAAEALLRELSSHGSAARVALLGALARRGDAEARADLLSRIGEGEALTEALFAIPKDAEEAVVAALLGDDAERAHDVLRALDEADAYSPADLWDRAFLAGVPDRAVAAKLPVARLVDLALHLPFGRTRTLGAAILEGLDRTTPPELEDEDEVFTFLETVDAEALRELLRTWARTAPGRADDLASYRFALGDPQDAQGLADWLRAADQDARDAVSPLWLARTGGPLMRDALARVAGGATSMPPWKVPHGVAGLAAMEGLPEDAARSLFAALSDEEVPDGLVAAARDAVLAGRPDEAVLRVLAAMPSRRFEDVHLCGDRPEVRAYLGRLRTRREWGEYAWATAELALLGDTTALRETDDAIADGRYRWFEQLTWRQIARGDPVAAAPRMIEHLGSNCCHEADVLSVFFDGAFGWETTYGQFGGVMLPIDEARTWWTRSRGRFVPSRIAGHLVPAP